MRLAVSSDTHLPRGPRAIPDASLERCREADAILHAGDFTDVAVLAQLRSLGPPVHAIHGNVDSVALRRLLPGRLELELAGVWIGLVHAPGPAARRFDALRLAFQRCDAVIFGRTHLSEHAERDGFQILNPESSTERRRAPAHTMVIATIADRRVAFEMHAVR